MPTASAIGAPPVSSRMPATLPPASSTSFGHFSASVSGRPVTATSVSWSASAATNERSAASAGGPPGVISRLAAKLPGGITQGRPRRPRAAVWLRARIQHGPAAPEAARRSASALVLSSSSWISRPTPGGQSAMRYWNSVAAAAAAVVSIPNRLMTPNTIAAAEAPRNSQCSAGMSPSRPSAGSPKYIR